MFRDTRIAYIMVNIRVKGPFRVRTELDQGERPRQSSPVMFCRSSIASSAASSCGVHAQDSGGAGSQERAMDVLWRYGCPRSSAINGEIRRERRRRSDVAGIA